jgi:hypothetical protein
MTAGGPWSGYAKDSVLHGFSQHFDSDKNLTLAGMTRNGVSFGTCWKLLPGKYRILIQIQVNLSRLEETVALA